MQLNVRKYDEIRRYIIYEEKYDKPIYGPWNLKNSLGEERYGNGIPRMAPNT